MSLDRLQKILSQAGVTSRREAEFWIRDGRVSVNGVVVKEMGVKADPDADDICVDGKPIYVAENKTYYLFYKPKNVVVTRKDPENRPTVFDYLKEVKERVNYVGRLDFDSEGLIFLTNDGELQARLTHPRYKIPKLYQVQLEKEPTPEELQTLRKGVNIGECVTQPCQVRLIQKPGNKVWVEMEITEGKNRQIRRMMEAVNHRVERLTRVALGPLRLSGLEPGRWRPLLAEEVQALQVLAGCAENVSGSRSR